MDCEIEVLTERIQCLEETNRRLRVMGCVVLLVSVALFLSGLGGKARVIEAAKIVVLDSHHRPRVVLGTPTSAGAAVGMERNEPAIWMIDESGNDRTILASDGLYLANTNARPVASFVAGPTHAELRLYGSDGKIVWSAP